MADWDLPCDPLLALRGGDPEPFEAFVRSHARRLYGFFRRQGAGQHKAEDLTQEVFLKLYHTAPRYRAQERFGAFCLRVARNLWIDDRRRAAARARELRFPVTEDGAEGPPPGATLGADRARGPVHETEVREEADRLRGALRELPEHHRAVFELGVIEELGYAEIASILEIPVGTVKSRMFHAVRRLRRALGEPEPDGSPSKNRGSRGHRGGVA